MPPAAGATFWFEGPDADYAASLDDAWATAHAAFRELSPNDPDHFLPYAVTRDQLSRAEERSGLSVRASLDHLAMHGCLGSASVLFQVADGLADGALRPYHLWMPASGTAPSFAHFGTGVSGQILPTALLDRLHERGEAFLERAPRADDVWINATAVGLGIRTAQVEEQARNFPFVPATQATGLYQLNVAGRENDRQLAGSLEPADVARICADFATIQAAREG